MAAPAASFRANPELPPGPPATVQKSAQFNAFWETILRAQATALRAANQKWSYDSSRRLLALIIEPRSHHPMLEPVVRNAMAALNDPSAPGGPDQWNLMIVTHDAAYVNGLFPGSTQLLQAIPQANLNFQEYSSLLTHVPFWEAVATRADVVAIFQTDVVFFRPIPPIYLAYDYAGANFFGARFVSPRVGGINGGFSLRRPSAMLDCIRRVPNHQVCARMGAPPNAYIPEDVYYSHACDILHKHVPPISDRKHLAIESEYFSRPAAFHGFQYSADYFTMDQCRKLVSESALLCAYATDPAPLAGPAPSANAPAPSGALAIVVARYKESVDWLTDLPANATAIIYNKSYDPLIIDDCVRVQTQTLPNVGRESHTYLTYIVTHYDTLPDRVFFTQAGLSEHFAEPASGILQRFLTSDTTVVAPFTEGLTPDARIGNYCGEFTAPAETDGVSWFRKYVTNDPSVDIDALHIWYSGIFCVSRERIRSRSRGYYADLLSQLSKDKNPEIGHYFERSWYYIFQYHTATATVATAPSRVV